MKKSLLRKTLFLLLIMLILSSITFAEREDLSIYDKMKLSLRLSNEIKIKGTASYLIANLSWFPRQTYRQKATINTYNGDLVGETVNYRWNNPPSKVTLLLTSNIELNSNYKKIFEKIPYPSKIPSNISPYLKPGEIIDINEDIERLALSLTANKDDYYSAVFSIANWVTTNIKYDLNSLTSQATQKSSWVLKQKIGVCDELTSLLISLLRASGIPARFVSGISYTNLETLDEWGDHGWAEVYFPGVGWVPFDVTYGQYGYLDATHIKLKDSIDTKDNNLEYSMLSKNAEMITSPLQEEVKVLNKQKNKYSSYTARLEIYDDKVSQKSYNLLMAKIKSNLPYYSSARFSLSQTEGLEVLGHKDKNLLFKPYEEKTIYYVLKQLEDVPEGYYVTYPLKLYTARGELASTSFQAKNSEDYYGLDFFQHYLNKETQELITPINCEEKKTYVGSKLKILCKTNTNKTRAKICFNNNCFYEDPRSFEITTTCEDTGTISKILFASATSLNAKGIVRYKCLDKANISINIINKTSPVDYDDKAVIKFILNRKSDSVPKNLTIKIVHDNFEQEWFSEELQGKKAYELIYYGKMLDLKNNTFKIIVSFKDVLGQTYKEENDFKVELKRLSLSNKIMIYLYEIERYIRKKLGVSI